MNKKPSERIEEIAKELATDEYKKVVSDKLGEFITSVFEIDAHKVRIDHYIKAMQQYLDEQHEEKIAKWESLHTELKSNETPTANIMILATADESEPHSQHKLNSVIISKCCAICKLRGGCSIETSNDYLAVCPEFKWKD